MLKRLILVVAALGLVAGAAAFWLLWRRPGQSRAPIG